jgi:hypothetical protein
MRSVRPICNLPFRPRTTDLDEAADTRYTSQIH